MDIYKAHYIGKLYIQKLNPIGYKIDFGFDTPEVPFTLYAEIPDSEFIKFLKNELRSSRFNRVFYGQINKVMPEECTKISTKCGCHDKR